MMRSLPACTAVVLISFVLALSGCHRTPSVLNGQEANTIHYGGGSIAVDPPETKSKITPADIRTAAKSMWLKISASKEIQAKFRARLLQADGSQPNKGEVDLAMLLTGTPELIDGQPTVPPHLIISVPLSSNSEAYGELRTCSLGPQGVPIYHYTAGLDEDNFVSFAPMASEREFRFSLNKYLCRALVAPYSCQGAHGRPTQESTPADMSHWHIENAEIMLSSSSSFARVDVSEITLTSTGKPFDYATCAKVAPSDGICCVAHKETQWHCGTKPEGNGWHQVSGSCYHRETGATCTQ